MGVGFRLDLYRADHVGRYDRDWTKLFVRNVWGRLQYTVIIFDQRSD